MTLAVKPSIVRSQTAVPRAKAAGQAVAAFAQAHPAPKNGRVRFPKLERSCSVKGKDGKEIGTIIVSVADAVFCADNSEHEEVAKVTDDRPSVTL
ncbi:hypothetical protein [Burkholderia sp. ABCPW 11]|uniref:hypothetical protein n=1 Tax=Burkholderia sp. ABCPW 11 TaxID=1637859 RepID=UPI0012FE04C4|nr:hypothetical protein [Burkholderia sp. ABCPW 11]